MTLSPTGTPPLFELTVAILQQTIHEQSDEICLPIEIKKMEKKTLNPIDVQDVGRRHLGDQG
jgi:hypothetical protein